MHSVVYQVRFESHACKRPTWKFVHDNTIIYSAKQKYNEIFIAEGAEIHIRKRDSHVCLIIQKETGESNTIRNGKKDEFKVKYVESGSVNHYSIESTFENNGQTLSWIPKPTRYDPKTKKNTISISMVNIIMYMFFLPKISFFKTKIIQQHCSQNGFKFI